MRRTYSPVLAAIAFVVSCSRPQPVDLTLHVTNEAWPCKAHVVLDGADVGVIAARVGSLTAHGIARDSLPIEATIDGPEGTEPATATAAIDQDRRERAKGADAVDYEVRVWPSSLGITVLVDATKTSRELSLGAVTVRLEPGEKAPPLRFHIPRPQHDVALKLDGRSIGVVPNRGALFIDPTGERCYSLAHVTYSADGTGSGPPPQHLAAGFVHALEQTPDYLFEDPPDEIRSRRSSPSFLVLKASACD